MAKAKETKKAMSAEEKAAKKKARQEAIKNRPAGQRCNSKQIDVIETENGTVETWGYPVVAAARKHIGVLTTTIVKDKEGKIISTSSTWVPGDLTIKAKKGHGIITGVKHNLYSNFWEKGILNWVPFFRINILSWKIKKKQSYSWH